MKLYRCSYKIGQVNYFRDKLAMEASTKEHVNAIREKLSITNMKIVIKYTKSIVPYLDKSFRFMRAQTSPSESTFER